MNYLKLISISFVAFSLQAMDQAPIVTPLDSYLEIENQFSLGFCNRKHNFTEESILRESSQIPDFDIKTDSYARYFLHRIGTDIVANNRIAILDRSLKQINKERIAFQGLIIDPRFQPLVNSYYDGRAQRPVWPKPDEQLLGEEQETLKKIMHFVGYVIADVKLKTIEPQISIKQPAKENNKRQEKKWPIFTVKVGAFASIIGASCIFFGKHVISHYLNFKI